MNVSTRAPTANGGVRFGAGAARAGADAEVLGTAVDLAAVADVGGTVNPVVTRDREEVRVAAPHPASTIVIATQNATTPRLSGVDGDEATVVGGDMALQRAIRRFSPSMRDAVGCLRAE